MFNIPNNIKPSLSLGSSPEPIQTQTPSQNNYNHAPQQPQAQKGVRLVKGQKISLTSISPGLDLIDVCLGWDVGTNTNYDLDSSAFMLGSNDRVLDDDYFVFYGQRSSPDNSILHSGDNKTGQGDGDDEIIHITLSKVNPSVSKIVFVVTINEAKQNNYNFGQVKNAFIRVVNRANNAELVRFELTEYYSNVTSMVVGALYKHSNEWKFNPIGDGTSDDLEGLCIRYGVNIIE